MTQVEHIKMIQAGLKKAGLLNAEPVEGVWCPHTLAAFEAYAYRHPQFQAHEGKMMPRIGDARIANLIAKPAKVEEPKVEIKTEVTETNPVLVKPKKADKVAKPE